MRIYSVSELTYNKNIDKEIILKLISNYTEDSYIFFVKKPENIRLFKSDTKDLLYRNKKSILVFKSEIKDVILTGELLDADFLKVKPNQLSPMLKMDKIRVHTFFGFSFFKEPLNNTKNTSNGFNISLESLDLEGLDAEVVLPFDLKNNDQKKLRSVMPVTVSLEMLYIGIPTDIDYELEELKHILRVNEKIPPRVISKVKKLPKINEDEFYRLSYLREANKQFWSDYEFKEYTLKKVYKNFEEEACYEFEEWFPSPKFINRDKPIKKSIQKINRKVDSFILEKFKNEPLGEGLALGAECAKAAADFSRPSFEFYEGRLKKKYEGYFPVRLWILYQASKFIWSKIEKNNYLKHPLNTLVADFFYSLNVRINVDKISTEALGLRDAFLKQYPEILFYPNERFTKEESFFAATLIRPNWAYAKHKKMKYDKN